MESDFITIFGILLLIITAISFLVKLLKQPIIIGYVLAGVAFSVIFISKEVTEQVHIFSEIGITFLLFLMGMEFDLKSLKYLGKDLFIATILQSLILFAVPFLIAIPFGFSYIESAYIGILFMFSSTLLTAKWINDKKENGTLHGKITLSILIIQDIIAILILTFIGILQESSFTKILLVPVQGIMLVLAGFVLAKYLLNKPLKIASRYPELLFLVGISVCFLFVEIAPLLGYSTTIGAFIGGVVLANTLYKTDLLSRLKPLVTFFNMLFFVGLGFQIQFSFSPKILIFLGLLLIMNFIIKPVVIYLTLRMRGYDLKTSFLAGVYLSQFSEFGIIILAGGLSAGQITGEINSIAIVSVILTMVLSSYLIKYDKKIFNFFEDKIIWFDKKFVTKEVSSEEVKIDCNILFFGYYDINKELMDRFKQQGKKVVVVENDPEHIAILEKEGIELVYSSINNPDFFEHHNFSKVEIVVSGLTDRQDNELIIHEVKRENPKALVIVTAKSLRDSIELYNHDADYVIYSAILNEQRVSVILDEYTSNINNVLEKKIHELKKLKDREKKLAATYEPTFSDIETFLKKTMSFSRKKHPKKGAVEEKKVDFEFKSLGEKYL